MIILALVLLFVAIILLRGAMFSPKKREEKEEIPIPVDEEKMAGDMSAMIQCKTVSSRDPSKVPEEEFVKFRSLLKEIYPHIFSVCDYKEIGKSGILLKWKGHSSDEPSVCMAHYDVVPVSENLWTKPPFEGVVEEGVIWGRGTLDTKSTLLSILMAANQLASEGFTPKNDLYFSFSGSEEIDGPCCGDIVTYLEERGIVPSIVLDEGGAVVENGLPTFKGESAMVGIGEKGTVAMEYVLKSQGGHAATPPKHTEIGQLAQAVVKTENHPFKARFTKPVLEMFDTMGRHLSFPYRILFGNLWCFAPLLKVIGGKSGGELNAMMRTTCAVTRAQGSGAYNVLPSEAKVGMNLRLLEGDTVESAKKHLEKIIDNDQIQVKVVQGGAPSPISRTDCPQWELLKETIEETWTTAVVSPYLMMACSDSRHYCRITDRVYRFAPMKLSKEERGMIHGNDERIPMTTLKKCVQFYLRFIRKL